MDKIMKMVKILINGQNNEYGKNIDKWIEIMDCQVYEQIDRQ